MDDRGSWHGIERSLLEWYPTIDSTKCNDCGMCILTCGNDVFRWNMDRNEPLVQNPGKCVIGCTTCGKLCPEDAISFPDDPKKFVRGIILKYKIFPKVKQDLEERIRKFPDHSVHLKVIENE
jgi:NAD-dependent dihydropyrimidine dehydrogenase PreA subunit